VPQHLPSLALPLGLQALSVCSSSSTRHEFRFALVLLAGAGGFTGGGREGYCTKGIEFSLLPPSRVSFPSPFFFFSFHPSSFRPTTRLLRIRGSFSKRRLFPVVAVLTSPPLLVYSADRGVGLVVGFRHHLFRVRSSNTHVSRAGGRVCPACTVPFFQIAGVVRREESAKIRVFYSSGLPRPLVRSTEDLCLHGHLLKEKKILVMSFMCADPCIYVSTYSHNKVIKANSNMNRSICPIYEVQPCCLCRWSWIIRTWPSPGIYCRTKQLMFFLKEKWKRLYKL
jgi:hypothetical protein